jgi:hypothetical protein
MKPTVQTVIDRMVAVCREWKRVVRKHRDELEGDWLSRPSRGPFLHNGRVCFRWHLWRNAVARHWKAHLELRDMIRATGCKPKGKGKP